MRHKPEFLQCEERSECYRHRIFMVGVVVDADADANNSSLTENKQ
ncbi:hypothetical protein [Photobacterium angustum]|nr:hypothetical protein [Photobacterium angustum]